MTTIMTIHNFTYRPQYNWEQIAAKYEAPEWSNARKSFALTGQRVTPNALAIAERLAKLGIEVFPVTVPAKDPKYKFIMYDKVSGAYYFKGDRDSFLKGEIILNGRFITVKI
jgi:hypothetical protein